MSIPVIKRIRLEGVNNVSHVQGMAIDRDRKYIYLSFTTKLVKIDSDGNIIGSVNGLIGHLGCIAYNYNDGMVYGSLEFKNDGIGRHILTATRGKDAVLRNGFYAVRFDVDKIDRLDMDAERDGIMTSVFLKEVTDDYEHEGHRYGCSGIDGTTIAPDLEGDNENCLYIAYGIYSDTSRCDNDHQIIVKYIIDNLSFIPLNQGSMHKCGPDTPDAKYFVYTGNTNFGVQNLEYDPELKAMLACVYPGAKPEFPNYPLYFIDCSRAPELSELKGVGEIGKTLGLADVNGSGEATPGSRFPHGSTGIVALGDGYYCISLHIKNENGFGCEIVTYKLDKDTLMMNEIN